MLRRVIAPLAALAVLLLSFGAVAAPATAHDALVASVPADGETLTTAPRELVLTYNNEIATIGAEVQISDPAGTVLTETPAVEGTNATVTLPQDLAPGAYSVAWRVTSSDGHPIEGTLAFTLDVPAPTAEPTTEAPTAEATTTTATATATTAEPTAGATVETATPEESTDAADLPGLGLPTWVLAVVGLAIVGAIVGLIVRLRRDQGTGGGTNQGRKKPSA